MKHTFNQIKKKKPFIKVKKIKIKNALEINIRNMQI